MLRQFNDKQGNRDRSCRYCIVHNGKAYTQQEAVEAKLAKFVSLGYNKNGKWSNTDWRVETNSAKLVVIMSPFDGWTDDMALCIDHVLSSYGNSDYGVTREEAELAFSFLYPNKYQKIKAMDATDLL